MADKKSKRVLQYSLDGELVREWKSTRDVQRTLGYHQGDISKCCKGKRKTAGGYVWKYKIEENIRDEYKENAEK